MRIHWLLYPCLMWTSLVPAQNKAAESLKNKLALYKAKDSLLVKMYFDCSYSLGYENYDSALFYMRKGVGLAKELQWKDGLAEGYLQLSSCKASAKRRLNK